jgi:hypothetical protein
MKKDTRNYSKHHPRFRQNYADGGAINPALTPTPMPSVVDSGMADDMRAEGLGAANLGPHQHPQPQLRISSVV